MKSVAKHVWHCCHCVYTH